MQVWYSSQGETVTLLHFVEFKYDGSAEGAIEQIKNKQYTDCLNDYYGDILLVGINYDKESIKHSCKIEKIKK